MSVQAGHYYYIKDSRGYYYRVNHREQLICIFNGRQAETFTLEQAKYYINKSRNYGQLRIVAVNEDRKDSQENNGEKIACRLPAKELISSDKVDTEKPVSVFKDKSFEMLETFGDEWEKIMTQLNHMSNHVKQYVDTLTMEQYKVNKEIGDLLHYLEFYEHSDEMLLKLGRMLKERRKMRRAIKEEMERSNFFLDNFADRDIAIKSRKCLEFLQHINQRMYEPRIYVDLHKEIKEAEEKREKGERQITTYEVEAQPMEMGVRENTENSSDVPIKGEFYLNRNGLKGTAVFVKDGFKLLKGSNVSATMDETIKKTMKLRIYYTEKGIIKDGIITEDIVFPSPHAALVFVLGQRGHGPLSWKNKAGITIKEIMYRISDSKKEKYSNN